MRVGRPLRTTAAGRRVAGWRAHEAGWRRRSATGYAVCFEKIKIQDLFSFWFNESVRQTPAAPGGTAIPGPR